MSTAKRLKTKAAAYAPQTKDDVAADIAKLGELQRELARATADMNDRIAVITKDCQPALEELQVRITTLQTGVQTWCEAHRSELTDGNKVKTVNLVTGEVNWRQRPPSVSVRGVEAVIDTLRRLGLGRFIRAREELNKEAILNEPDQVRGVAGLSIVTGQEDFSIVPFEQQAA